MAVVRFTSRAGPLYEQFLRDRLATAVRYDRIAGYFRSSLLEIAQEQLKRIPYVRIVCNADVNAADVEAARFAKDSYRRELEDAILRRVWNDAKFAELVDTYGHRMQNRLAVLYDLITASTDHNRLFQIRVVPDAQFGFLHGKGGVIEGPSDAIAFIGSANETAEAWTKNYELVWADAGGDSVQWMKNEFETLWEHGLPLSDYVVTQIQRLSKRKVVENVEEWREQPKLDTALVEAPANTELFGFWEHQKYFIDLAYRIHLRYNAQKLRGARFLLADGVGLGKTLQLGAVAKLIALQDDLPVLVIAPKPLVPQWQDELASKLAVPSARWESGIWKTELDEEHPFPIQVNRKTGCPRRVAIVPTSIVTSANNSETNRELRDRLLAGTFGCVIWDEAHKVRRKNLQSSRVYRSPEKNTLYDFALGIAGRTKTMLLATATPVQLHPIELWDLLNVLSVNNEQVLGDKISPWRMTQQLLFDVITGNADVDGGSEKWQWIRNPMPDPALPGPTEASYLRAHLGLAEVDAVAPESAYGELDGSVLSDIELHDLQETNPFTQWVIKRSRDELEKQGRLPKIELEPFHDDVIESSAEMIRAFQLAEEFSQAMNARLKESGRTAGGFIKTLIQRRVGSSLVAGLSTARRMLESRNLAGDEDPNEDRNSIYPLGAEERDLLGELVQLLEDELLRRTDPKFERVLWLVSEEYRGVSLLSRGLLIFSQFYDSALALSEFLVEQIGETVGLYAGGQSSRLLEPGNPRSIDREKLKAGVRSGDIKIMVGTDAASTGLNLQTLGSLINLDLPWNPTILEQRKGRVQRGAVSKTIPFSNLRYDQAVEAKLYEVLSNRLAQITKIFGVVPDFIVDEWIQEMLEGKQDTLDEDRLFEIASEHDKNPFTLKEVDEQLDADWEATAEVLNERVVGELLKRGW
jgi:superfamily II DNA or RNA helicase